MLFEIDAEVRDSAVTLSAALARYMIKKNQGEQKEMRVMPFKTMMNDCRMCRDCLDYTACPMLDYYGLDVNPDTESTGLEQEYIDTLEVLQWNEEEKTVGFLIDNPNVTGMLVAYGMRDEISRSMDTGQPVRLYVRPRYRYGRTQYIILRLLKKDLNMSEQIELWWTRWMVRLGLC